jgi:UDP-N-acetylmuramoyl-L-alanyl-D-glutamate--2,6-diaminopimelate ligase
MKQLKDLLRHIDILQTAGNSAVPVTKLIIDSREAEKNVLFFAQKGTLTDGHKFIDDVVAAGAAAVICEHLPQKRSDGVCYVQVKDVAEATGLIAAAFYDFPTRELKVIGVTGTNGKTTIATLLYKLFTTLGYKSGLVSTVQNQIGEVVLPAVRTTPDPVSLQSLFHEMFVQRCTYVFMEVSSHAIHQKRIAGIEFSGGIFSNITHDHLDYHKTFEEYIRVKKSFFDALPQDAFALSNKDDKRGEVMLQNTRAEKKYYAIRNAADFKGRVLANDLEGLQMMVNRQEVHFLLSGLFNAYNLLAVYGAAMLCHQDPIQTLAALSNMKGAPGRFETFRSIRENILGIVDYAHTPDALLNVLTTIKQFGGPGKIITVVGCGGDRDKTKRPVMAQVACEHSSKVLLTSDNPRTEDPESILNDMEQGLDFAQRRKVIRITDRKEAIKTACSLAGKGDIILVAGKGHENYQEIKGIKHHFDDKEILLEMFHLLGK